MEDSLNILMKKSITPGWMSVALTLCTLLGPSHTFAADKAKSSTEKHSWTLGYEPDEVVTFSKPAEGSPLELNLFFPADHKEGGDNGCIILFFGGGWSGGDHGYFYCHR